MLGDLQWGVETGGRLGDEDRLRYLEMAAKAQVASDAAAIARSHDRLRHVDLQDIEVPDTRLTYAAAAYCAQVSSLALLNHCFRCYHWGVLLALADGSYIRDEEVLFVAAMLHDLGVTERHHGTQQGIGCFAVEGAICASGWLAEQGCAEPKGQIIADAISLHLNPIIAPSSGETALYLQAGAYCDIMGRRCAEIPPRLVRQVVSDNPSEGVEVEFARFLEREHRARPDSRLGVFVTTQGENLPPLCPWRRLEAEPQRQGMGAAE